MPVRVYLDWNATSPPADEVTTAMREAAAIAWANPQSVHADGRAARAVVEGAREAVAVLTGRDPRDVVLTSGGTEANNVALRSAFAGEVANDDPSARPVLVTSRLEHPSITRVAEALEAERVARVVWLGVTPDGAVDLPSLDAALEGGARLVTAQAVSHETGVVQPVAEIVTRCRARGVRAHVDAIQAWGRVEVEGLTAADSASLAAHKLRGPKGVGALVTSPRLPLAPVLVGGAQEKGVRPGTVDPVAAAGLGAAARRAVHTGAWARLAPLRDRLEARLAEIGARLGVSPVFVGAAAPRAPHVSTSCWPGWSGAELVAALDLEGVSVSHGAACSAGTAEPSPALAAVVGMPLARSSVRVSMGETTTEDEVSFALAAFERVLSRA
ncbi:MAG: cysteine desulfurase family protein [Polyangiaceae bacterium]